MTSNNNATIISDNSMSNIINKQIVLVLSNVLWQPIGYISVKKALKAMFSTGEDAAQALDLDFATDSKGNIDFNTPIKYNAVSIDEWVKLPIRDFDLSVQCAKTAIRAPIVIITHNLKKMPMKQLKPTRRNIWEWYNRKCIWTNKELSFAECTKEHIKPKCKGRDDSWENVAPASKRLNNERGSTPLELWKYKMQYKLKEPPKMPISTFIKHAVRPEWQSFLIVK